MNVELMENPELVVHPDQVEQEVRRVTVATVEGMVFVEHVVTGVQRVIQDSEAKEVQMVSRVTKEPLARQVLKADQETLVQEVLLDHQVHLVHLETVVHL